MKTKSLEEQAREYVSRVGVEVARNSNHYLTAKRHCTCGDCFCCWVRIVVDEAQDAAVEKVTA